MEGVDLMITPSITVSPTAANSSPAFEALHNIFRELVRKTHFAVMTLAAAGHFGQSDFIQARGRDDRLVAFRAQVIGGSGLS